MPKYTREKRAEVKAKIRSILVRIPNASKYVLAESLGIDKDFALKLKKEVLTENTRRIDRQVVKREIAKLEMTYNEIETECWRIITGKRRKEFKDKDGNLLHYLETNNENRDIVQALKTLLDAKKKLFEIKFDAGIFKRQLGEFEMKAGQFIKLLSETKQHAKRKTKKKDSKGE